jgi:RNA polymerase sigma-70 factor (TIGR02943 family)
MSDQQQRASVETDAEKWVDDHGDYLYRFALTRLSQREAAEDVVQETFLAALAGKKRFAGASSERTWLIGILKRKIADYLRRKSRERPASDFEPDDGWIDQLFDARGNWTKKPGVWPSDPVAALENKEFLSIFYRCLSKLPQRLAGAFTLRALEGMAGDEVCKVLDVSANNLWVMLHRARLQLSRCLEINWFGPKS